MLKRNRRLIKSIVILIGFTVFIWAIYLFSSHKPGGNISVLKQEVGTSIPVNIKIPTIGADAPIDEVGTTISGAMDVPKSPSHTAWYMLGTRPGEIGSAVIDGHSGWKNNIPAVFDNLGKIKKGDKIYIEDNMGRTTVFTVTELRTYDPKASAKDIFNSYDGKSHLNLITCAGLWDDIEKTHSERLIVFSEKE